MTMRVSKCSDEGIPQVKLALSKERCLRKYVLPKAWTFEEVGRFLQKHYGCEAQEQFLAVGFNPRNEVLGVLEVGRGGIASALVDPVVLFSGLLLMGASAFVVAHNHPTGNPEPSIQDIALTKQLKQGGELLALRMLDHLILPSGGGEVVSMLARGMM